MADNDPPKPAAARSQSTNSSSTFHHPPRRRLTVRRSASERIDEILENARRRADDLVGEVGAGSSAVTGAHTPPPEGLRRSWTTLSLGADPVGETTAMLSGSPGRQSYSTLSRDGSVPGSPGHPSRSIYRRRHQNGSTTPTAAGSDGEDQDDEPLLGGQAEEKYPWWKKAVEPLRSIELENTGSVARDHLALERTFLAWLRTSLAFASIGIAVTQLFRLNTSLSNPSTPVDQDTLRKFGRPLGGAFLGISIVILLLGYRRFLVAQTWVIRGKFPASRGTVLALVLVTLAIMLLSLVVVVVIHPKNV